jgi:hypothetical protein
MPKIDHLAECHRINKDRPIPQQPSVFEAEKEENDPTIGYVFQINIYAFKAALIRWIIIAHIALGCVEVEAFRDLIQLSAPFQTLST